MAFWSTADVEIASRIITAKTKNDRRVRGKLTLHFAQAQTQSDADEAADRCAALAEGLLGEADDHAELIGAESDLVTALRLRLPPSIPHIRSIDLAALHVVGDPGTSAALRRASTGTFRAVNVPLSAPAPNTMRGLTPPPSAPPSSPPTSSMRAGQPISSAPSGNLRVLTSSSSPSSSVRVSSVGSSGPASGAVVTPLTPRGGPASKRGTLGRMRAITPSMLLAPGSPPEVIGSALAPFVRDCAARVLVGFLRAYDLLALRGLALEEGSADLLAALVPLSDTPLGGYEASRTAELGRWQNAFGEAVFDRVRRESQVAAVFLTYAELTRLGLPMNVAMEILQEAAPTAFAGEHGTVLEMGRYLSLPDDAVVPVFCDNLVEIVGQGDAAQLSDALAPLVTSVQEDMALAGTLARDATGL